MVGKEELGGERVRQRSGIGDAGWYRDGRESDGGERMVVMVGKDELGGESIRHGRGIGDAGWGRDGREIGGGERKAGR